MSHENRYHDDTCYRLRNKNKKDSRDKEKGKIEFKYDLGGVIKTITVYPESVLVLDGQIMNYIGADTINKHIEKGELSIKDLVIKPDVNYIIRNESSKIIGLNHHIHPNPLIIPPFGSRWLNYEFLKEYDFIDWKRLKLITIEEMVDYNQSFGSSLFTRLSIPFFNFVSRFWDWLKLTPGIILVTLLGFGIPFWIIYFFGDGRSLLGSSLVPSSNELAALGRLLQGCFIGLASTFPALLYFLFGRQQIQKLREKFYREMIVLDPHIQTISESKTIYDPLLDSVYGSGNSNSPFAIVLLLICTILLAFGWVITLLPIGNGPGSLIQYFTPNYNSITLGFLGAYFFTINMVFRRYVRADLTPKTYAHLIMRLLVTFVLVWAIGTIPEFTNGETANAILLITSFVVGIFPEAGLTLIMERWNKFTNQKESRDDALSLTNLEGINLYDRARLLEEGIESIENLAHHNLVELIARTRIPTPRLVDMFDQAILYLHLGIQDQDNNETFTDGTAQTNQSKIDKSELTGKYLLNQLKFFGIRTATDLLNCMKDLEKNKSAIGKLNMDQLKNIANTLKDDEWLDHIVNWRSTSMNNELVTNPYTFYKATVGKSP